MVKPVISRSQRRRKRVRTAKLNQQNVCNRFLWKLVSHCGIPMRISLEDLESVPADAGVNVKLDGDTVVFTATGVPEKPNIVLPESRIIVN